MTIIRALDPGELGDRVLLGNFLALSRYSSSSRIRTVRSLGRLDRCPVTGRRGLEPLRMSEEPYANFRSPVSSIGRSAERLDPNRHAAKDLRLRRLHQSPMCCFSRLDAGPIRACADKNPIKWGRRTPGTRIPIVSEDVARADADYFLVLPWSFKFLVRETAFRARGGKFIFPLPEIEMC
jgi:hypothetical protein